MQQCHDYIFSMATVVQLLTHDAYGREGMIEDIHYGYGAPLSIGSSL